MVHCMVIAHFIYHQALGKTTFPYANIAPYFPL